MDKVVLNYYRKLCQTGFVHAGKIDNPSIFLDSIGEKIRICSHTGRSYIHVYLNVNRSMIEDVKYLCTCDPTTNVVVELLCLLIEGKTIEEADKLSEEAFVKELDSRGEQYLRKTRGIITLLKRGISRYKAQLARTSKRV